MDLLRRILLPIRRHAMLRHIRRNERAFVKRVGANPWTHEYRRVKAEVERTGDETLYADFERRYLADLEARYPQAARRARRAGSGRGEER